jgi:UrcA family protein
MTEHKNIVKMPLAAGICAALVAGAASSAAAKDVTVRAYVQEEVPSEHVTYADLNLASVSGVKTLKTRVGAAVGRVCSPQYDAFANMNCRAFAWRGANPQIDLAVARATEIAQTGKSAIAPVAISIVANY